MCMCNGILYYSLTNHILNIIKYFMLAHLCAQSAFHVLVSILSFFCGVWMKIEDFFSHILGGIVSTYVSKFDVPDESTL